MIPSFLSSCYDKARKRRGKLAVESPLERKRKHADLRSDLNDRKRCVFDVLVWEITDEPCSSLVCFTDRFSLPYGRFHT